VAILSKISTHPVSVNGIPYLTDFADVPFAEHGHSKQKKVISCDVTKCVLQTIISPLNAGAN
jgi:hypothetical protein